MNVRNQYIVPGIVGCALFMQMLDSTVVATALPAMAHALDTSPVRMNVVITTYLLAVAMFVPLCGWAADRFGARRVFMAAILLFTASSAFCAVAGSLTHLVLGRLLQGVAGAMMVPVGRVILLRAVPKAELVQAMSFLSIPALLGPMVGPPLGGLLVTYASWHWIFLINLPIGALGIWLVQRYIPRLEERSKGKPLDWRGFLLTSGSLVAVVFSVEALGHGLLHPLVSLAILAGGIGLAWGYWRYARDRSQAIIDLRLLRIPTFHIANLGGNLSRFSIGALPFLLVMLLQEVFGMTALAAGMITFVGAVGALLLKLVAVPLLRWLGFRRSLMINAITTGAFTAVCAWFTPSTPIWVMLAVLLLGGFFRSLQLTSVNTLTYADVPQEAMARASAFASMAQQVGISLGVAVAAVSLNLSMAWRGASQLAAIDVAVGFVVTGLIVAASALFFSQLDPQAGDEVSGRGARRRGASQDGD